MTLDEIDLAIEHILEHADDHSDHALALAVIVRAALPVVEAAVYAEDILGFHEGSEQVLRDGGKPVVCINAQGDDGDFQVTLGKLRAALAAFDKTVAEMKP